MAVSPLSLAAFLGDGSPATPAAPSHTIDLRKAVEAARKLNNLEITDRKYSVIRDPESHRFVVVVLDKTTGTVLDQLPPEAVLRMLDQLSPYSTSRPAETEGTQA